MTDVIGRKKTIIGKKRKKIQIREKTEHKNIEGKGGHVWNCREMEHKNRNGKTKQEKGDRNNTHKETKRDEKNGERTHMEKE